MDAIGWAKATGSRFLRRGQRFDRSDSYWKERYKSGGTSGSGSYGVLAEFKASVLNGIVADRGYQTVLELGCGDGAQLTLADYPEYLGVDVSEVAVSLCRERFADDPTKTFLVSGEEPLRTCDLGLSLDVIYHLVEDAVFEQYMHDLLHHSARAVVLYTSDSDVFVPPRREPAHVRHRPIQRWMANQPEWRFVERLANPMPWRADDQDHTSFADLYVFERN